LLYGLTPDVTVLASVSALLLSAFAAGFIPARRAASVDPSAALLLRLQNGKETASRHSRFHD